MHKESWVFYFIRLSLMIILCLGMAMVYWSSLLLEEQVKQLSYATTQISNLVTSLKRDLKNQPASFEQKKQDQTKLRLHINPQLPNLLEEDPFYLKTLPQLLPLDFSAQGTLYEDVIGKPDNLHPFSNWAQVRTWTGMCTGAVAKLQIGKYESYAPDLALKMEKRPLAHSDRFEYWIHLREDIFWQPLTQEMFSHDFTLAPLFLKKHAVTAHDFKFFFDAIMNPYNQLEGAVAQRPYLEDIEEFKVIDDLTFTVRWKVVEKESKGKKIVRTKYVAKQWTSALQPLACFVYRYFADGTKIIEEDSDPETYRTSSVWAQNFTEHFAKNAIPSCGGWTFEKMTDRQINFRRNEDFYAPLDILIEKSVQQFKNSFDGMWQDFKANKIDSYLLQPNQILELEQFLHSPLYQAQLQEGAAIKQVDYMARQYAYIGWNEARPFFKNKRVRQALTMAIDRARIIREFLNGKGVEITGTFFKSSPSTDPSIQPWPFDLRRARVQLQEEGWYDSDGDGIIDQVIEGKSLPFKFNLTYFVKNPVDKMICEFIATSLKELGILCNLQGVDIADLSKVFEDKDFDALLLRWGLGTPPEDPKQLWFSKAASQKGSSNAIGFANAEVDRLIEELQYEDDSQTRTKLYYQFDRIIHEEQPYTFLFTPMATFLYRSRLQNVFLPSKRQDLIPGATIDEPVSSLFWLKTAKD